MKDSSNRLCKFSVKILNSYLIVMCLTRFNSSKAVYLACRNWQLLATYLLQSNRQRLGCQLSCLVAPLTSNTEDGVSKGVHPVENFAQRNPHDDKK